MNRNICRKCGKPGCLYICDACAPTRLDRITELEAALQKMLTGVERSDFADREGEFIGDADPVIVGARKALAGISHAPAAAAATDSAIVHEAVNGPPTTTSQSMTGQTNAGGMDAQQPSEMAEHRVSSAQGSHPVTPPTTTAPGEDWPECRAFYDLMQAYRWAGRNHLDPQTVVDAYEAVKAWLRADRDAALPRAARAEKITAASTMGFYVKRYRYNGSNHEHVGKISWVAWRKVAGSLPDCVGGHFNTEAEAWAAIMLAYDAALASAGQGKGGEDGQEAT